MTSKVLHIRVAEAMVKRIDRIAQAEKRTKNNTVCLLIGEALDNRLAHRVDNEGQAPEFETVNQLTK